MNRIFVALVVVAAFILTAASAGEAQASPGKVGFVDLEKALTSTPAGKRASKQFENYRKTKQAELDRKQKALQKFAADLQKQRSVLKPEVLRQKSAKLQKRYVEVQQLYVKLERELTQQRTKLIRTILKKAAPVIKDIAKREGYTMILDRSAVLYADPAHDLTNKVMSRLK